MGSSSCAYLGKAPPLRCACGSSLSQPVCSAMIAPTVPSCARLRVRLGLRAKGVGRLRRAALRVYAGRVLPWQWVEVWSLLRPTSTHLAVLDPLANPNPDPDSDPTPSPNPSPNPTPSPNWPPPRTWPSSTQLPTKLAGTSMPALLATEEAPGLGLGFGLGLGLGLGLGFRLGLGARGRRSRARCRRPRAAGLAGVRAGARRAAGLARAR